MKERKWNSGPPPFIGWWNACITNDPNEWRWWNGVNWSISVYEKDSDPEHFAEILSIFTPLLIRWTDYWPENARVPRIDPRKEKQ